MRRRVKHRSLKFGMAELGKRGRVTIRDVAAAAGVSAATVSYVLNGHAKVGPEAAKAVREAVRRLGYLPNRAARALRTGRPQVIGCVLPTLASPVFPEIAHAVQARAQELGLATLLVDAGDDPEREVAALALLAEHGAAGAIAVLAPGWCGASPVPLTLLDSPVCGYDAVMADHEAGGALQARHAVALGHRRIGLLSGREPVPSNQLRRKGALAALAEAGLYPAWQEHVPLTLDLSDRARLALSSGRATCILCVNDIVAMAALSHLRSSGVAVPEAVSVIGFDDIAMAGWPLIDLTTVRQPLRALAERAVDLLARRLDEPSRPPEVVTLPVVLVERSTTTRLWLHDGCAM